MHQGNHLIALQGEPHSNQIRIHPYQKIYKVEYAYRNLHSTLLEPEIPHLFR